MSLEIRNLQIVVYNAYMHEEIHESIFSCTTSCGRNTINPTGLTFALATQENRETKFRPLPRVGFYRARGFMSRRSIPVFRLSRPRAWFCGIELLTAVVMIAACFTRPGDWPSGYDEIAERTE